VNPTRRKTSRTKASKPAARAGKSADAIAGRKIVLGVAGCIAAYKAASIASALTKRGAEVLTVMTEAAQKFVTPLTFRTLTGRPVVTDLFDERAVKEPAHVSAAEWAEVVLIAPATANVIGKLANGICDDMLTCTVTAAAAPVIIAPAMNDRMYGCPSPTRSSRPLKRSSGADAFSRNGRFIGRE